MRIKSTNYTMNKSIIPVTPSPLGPSKTGPIKPGYIPSSYYATRDFVMRWVDNLSKRIDDISEKDFKLSPATKETLGGVIVGDGLGINDAGVLSLSGDVQEAISKKVVEYIKDSDEALTAVSIGTRKSGSRIGPYTTTAGTGHTVSGSRSFTSGINNTVTGMNSAALGKGLSVNGYCAFATGNFSKAIGDYSIAMGLYATANEPRSFVWCGKEVSAAAEDEEEESVRSVSNGPGTYTINPEGGIEGFFVGDKNLKAILAESNPTKFVEITPHVFGGFDEVFPEMDGKVNYVTEKLTGYKPGVDFDGYYFLSMSFEMDMYHYESDTSRRVKGSIRTDYLTRLSSWYDDTIGLYCCSIKTMSDSNVEDLTGGGVPIYNEDLTEIIGVIPEGRVITLCSSTDFSSTLGEIDCHFGTPETLNFYADFVSSIRPFGQYEGFSLIDLFDIHIGFTQYGQPAEPKQLHICFDLGTDSTTYSGPARNFLLTVEADNTDEAPCIFDGTYTAGSISFIPTHPRATWLAVGPTTWQVHEVCPHKFVVTRLSPKPLDEGVDITGAGGKTYTLSVDQDGVLEVKEK